jgi:aromatic amino acid aminotransferase I
MTIRARNANKVKEGDGTNSTSSMSCERGESAYDLDIALNYGGAIGSPQVLRFITEHVEIIHKPAYDDWKTCVTCGTTSATEQVLRMLCNSGDWVLAEAYTYSGAIEVAKALGLNILGVEMDDVGLLPEDLDSKLRNWDVARGAKPSALYTIPSGHNPTGTTQTIPETQNHLSSCRGS